MTVAGAGEWPPVPVSPAIAEGHPCHLSHQVELGWPHVPVRGFEGLELSVDLPPMSRHCDLSGQVILLDPDVLGGGDEHDAGLAACKPLQLGNVVLDQEIAARLQVPRSIGESGNLFFQSREIRDRVADQVHEAELGVDTRGREIADLHIYLAPTLSMKLTDHVLGKLDAGYPNPAGGQW